MTKEDFTRLVHKYTDTVYRVAVNMLKCPAAADDVCQEVFLRLWRSDRSFESEGHIRNWLIRVAVNESRRILSSMWNRYENIDDCSDALSFDTPEQGELYRLVMTLPQKYRIVIYLYYYEGYSTAEIAKMLGVPDATVRTRLRRGRASLKNIMTEAENE